jgi:hypothetical protein
VTTPPATRTTGRWLALVLVLGLSRAALADEPPHVAEAARLADDQWAYRAGGRLVLDGGLVMGPPMTLPTGMATGVGAGLLFGRRVALGVRASFTTTTESSLDWTVTHDLYRLRGVVAVQRAVGRGVLGLRLDLGGSVVHEDRTRNQTALGTTATALLPGGELEVLIAVHVAGPWRLEVAGGPAALVEDGALRGGWIAQLGVGWQP